jgi:hypothetical protein
MMSFSAGQAAAATQQQRFPRSPQQRLKKKSAAQKSSNKNKLFLGVRKCLLKDNKTVYQPVCFAIKGQFCKIKATNFWFQFQLPQP